MAAASSSNAPLEGAAWQPFSDSYHEQACALHVVAEAIAVVDLDFFNGHVADWVDMAQEKIVSETGQNLNLPVLMNKLVSTLSYYTKNGSSSKWSREVVDLIKNTHSVHVQKLHYRACKAEIRTNSRYKCHLCGTHEKNCNFIVHLAGGPAYNADRWLKSDTADLLKAWQDFIGFYGAVIDSKATNKDDRYHSDVYTGIIVPGETCLKRLLLAIKAQNVVLEVVYDTRTTLAAKMRSDTFDEESALPCTLFDEEDVQRTAALIELIHRAQANSSVPEIAEDDTFWKITLDRFARIQLDASPAQTHTPRFLRAAYEQMNASLGRGGCGTCADDDEEQDEDDEDYEGGGAAADDMSDFIEEDDDAEDAQQEEEEVFPLRRGGNRRAKRSRTVVMDDEDDEEEGEEHAPAKNTRVPQEAEEAEEAEEEASSLPPRTGATPRDQQRLLTAAQQAGGPSSSTARGLRAHPGNALHSRRETLDDLIRTARGIDDLGQKSTALSVASVLSICLHLNAGGSVADPRSELSKQVHRAVRSATGLAADLASTGAVQSAAILCGAVCVLAEFKERWDCRIR